MKEQRQYMMKPAFLQDVTKLPAKEMQQVMEKITLLMQDPLPDGKVKKQLTHHPGKPYRLRSGKYRIFYTFNQQCIFLFKLDMRDESTYKDDIVAEEVPDADVLEGLAVEMLDDVEPGQAAHTYWEQKFAQPQSRPLPEPITTELLKQLQVPEMYATRLQQIKDEEALFKRADPARARVPSHSIASVRCWIRCSKPARARRIFFSPPIPTPWYAPRSNCCSSCWGRMSSMCAWIPPIALPMPS